MSTTTMIYSPRVLRVSFERIEHDFERVAERLATRVPPGLYEQIDDPELRLRIDRAQETIDVYARQSRMGPVEGNQNQVAEWKKMLQDYEVSWTAAIRYITTQNRKD